MRFYLATDFTDFTRDYDIRGQADFFSHGKAKKKLDADPFSAIESLRRTNFADYAENG